MAASRQYRVPASGSLFHVAFDSVSNPCAGFQVLLHDATGSTTDIRLYRSNAFNTLEEASASFYISSSHLWKWDEAPEVVVTNFSGTNSGSRCFDVTGMGHRFYGLRIRTGHASLFTIFQNQKKSS